MGSSWALWPQLQALLLLGASAESQTLSSRPIWPTFGPPQLGRGGETLPGLRLTPLAAGALPTLQSGVPRPGARSAAGPDLDRDLGDRRLWDAAPGAKPLAHH